MEDLKKSKKLYFQLLVFFNLDIFSIQPNFIARGIACRLDAFIIGLFLKILSIVEIFSINNYQFS